MCLIEDRVSQASKALRKLFSAHNAFELNDRFILQTQITSIFKEIKKTIGKSLRKTQRKDKKEKKKKGQQQKELFDIQ